MHAKPHTTRRFDKVATLEDAYLLLALAKSDKAIHVKAFKSHRESGELEAVMKDLLQWIEIEKTVCSG